MIDTGGGCHATIHITADKTRKYEEVGVDSRRHCVLDVDNATMRQCNNDEMMKRTPDPWIEDDIRPLCPGSLFGILNTQIEYPSMSCIG